MEVKYTINGTDFRSDQVVVSGSKGLLSMPKRKKPLTHSWAEYHGEVIDLDNPVYEPREITLDCFCKGDSRGAFIGNVHNFLGRFTAPGLHRLMVDIGSGKPLVYEVYLQDDVDVKKRWREGRNVGTFSIKLMEPEPVKRVIKFTGANASVTLTSDKLVNIYWGDGQSDLDVSGTDVTRAHDYGSAAERYVVITGNIDEITNFSTTGDLIWNRL